MCSVAVLHCRTYYMFNVHAHSFHLPAAFPAGGIRVRSFVRVGTGRTASAAQRPSLPVVQPLTVSHRASESMTPSTPVERVAAWMYASHLRRPPRAGFRRHLCSPGLK